MHRTALYLTVITAALTISGLAPAAERAEARANQVPLRLDDANGKVVGRVVFSSLSQNASWYVVMQESKQIFAVPFGNYGPEMTKVDFLRGELVFATPDCSGQPYVSLLYYFFGPLRVATVISAGGQTMAYVGADIAEDFQAQSQRDDSGCRAGQSRMFAVPVADVIDITGKYQPPFSIR